MPKQDLHHLQLKGRTWFCVKDVPRDLRRIMGKRRLSRSLHTPDVRAAMAERYRVLAEFAVEFKNARRPGEADAVMREAMSYRQTLRMLESGDGSAISVVEDRGEVDLRKKQSFVRDLIDERALDLAGIADWDHEGRADAQRLAVAQQFAGVAHGTRTPLLLHMDKWLAEGNRRTFSPLTVAAHKGAVNMFAALLKPHGVTTIESCTRAVVGRVVSELDANGYDPGTIHVRLAAMSSYWVWLLRKGIINEDVRNPWRGQDIAARPKVARRSVEDTELVSLLTGTAGPEIHDVTRLLALSGLRVEEAYQLKVADCRDGWLHVRAGKGGKPRRVPTHSALVEIIAQRCAGKKADAFLMHEPGGPSDRRSVSIVGRFGKYRQKVGVHERADNARRSAVTLHSLRKWFATQARRSSDVHTVAILLGHRAAEITDRVYNSGPTEAALRQCVESVKLPTLAPG